MKEIRRIHWLLPLALLLCAGTGVFLALRTPNQMAFVTHWTQVFRRYGSPERFTDIAQQDRPDLICLRRFDNGDWIAARTEYSCTDGAGFDATVFIDSKGALKYQTGHHFCGYEGLSCDIRGVQARSLAEFYEHMTNVQFKVIAER